MKNKITILPIIVISTISFSQVVINEVLYDPVGVDTGLEWIELKNIGASVETITGYDLKGSDGDYFYFSIIKCTCWGICSCSLGCFWRTGHRFQ